MPTPVPAPPAPRPAAAQPPLQVLVAGADKDNYRLDSVEGTTADITPLGISGSFTAADKVYDGTAAAIINGRSLDGAISGDDVHLSGGSATAGGAGVLDRAARSGRGLQRGRGGGTGRLRSGPPDARVGLAAHAPVAARRPPANPLGYEFSSYIQTFMPSSFPLSTVYLKRSNHSSERYSVTSPGLGCTNTWLLPASLKSFMYLSISSFVIL